MLQAEPINSIMKCEMADNDSRIPEQVVSEFIRAMNDWEVDAYKRYKESIFDENDHAKILAASEKAGDERKGVIAAIAQAENGIKLLLVIHRNMTLNTKKS